MLDILVFMDILWFDWHFSFDWHFRFDWQPSKSACPTSVEGEVLHILDPNSSLPMSARHARLLPLAHAHPRQVLAVLESQMEFDTGVWLCASQCIHQYSMHLISVDCHRFMALWEEEHDCVICCISSFMICLFGLDDISAAQIQRWQCILAPDVSPSPVSTDVAVPMFEHICRLLYKLEPKKLVKHCTWFGQLLWISEFLPSNETYQLACVYDIL